MKNTFILLAFAAAYFTDCHAQKIVIEKVKTPIEATTGRMFSPTSAYDPMKRILFIWTNKGECDVTISIYKDDEEVAYETIFVEPGEEISCDFSDCEAGEYTIYTTVDGEMELIDTITVK